MIAEDRYAWFTFFFDNFCNVDKLHGTRISDEAWNASFQVAVGSSAYATLACVSTWLTDFRADLPKITVPRWSSKAARTASCPSTPPADAFPPW
jgi:non-heme chloroperoxidase